MSQSDAAERTPAEDGRAEERLEPVWDPVIRIFHWALVVAVSAAWILGDNLSFALIGWHFWAGYAVGGLVLLRLLWGLVGPKPARLASLFFSPGAILAYMRGVFSRRPSLSPGHNPMGALSVLAILATLLVQVGTGLFAYSDDFFSGGPLSGFIDARMQGEVAAIHELSANALLLLVVLHLGAVLFYYVWKRENLILPMITGRKRISKK